MRRQHRAGFGGFANVSAASASVVGGSVEVLAGSGQLLVGSVEVVGDVVSVVLRGILELAAASMAKPGLVDNRSGAQHWLRESGYTPSQIKISPIKRLGARLFRANVRFDDHDARENGNGRYQIVSVESIIGFVIRMDGGARQFVVALD